VHLGSTDGLHGLEERIVERTPEAGTALAGVDADEVDVRRAVVCRRRETNQEPHQARLAVSALGDQAGGEEVIKEDPLKRADDGPSPPKVDERDDRVV